MLLHYVLRAQGLVHLHATTLEPLYVKEDEYHPIYVVSGQGARKNLHATLEPLYLKEDECHSIYVLRGQGREYIYVQPWNSYFE